MVWSLPKYCLHLHALSCVRMRYPTKKNKKTPFTGHPSTIFLRIDIHNMWKPSAASTIQRPTVSKTVEERTTPPRLGTKDDELRTV